MVNAEAGQASDGVSLQQLVQADRTFTRVLRQDVLWKTTHITSLKGAAVEVVGRRLFQ